MTASLVLKETTDRKDFYIGDKPFKIYKIHPDELLCLILDAEELQHAITNLGAAKVNRTAVTYFGDEAKRIFYNW